MASSSSSSSMAVHYDQVKYDVFISFRGVDTRDSFTSHIYSALCRKKVETYIDYKLERGHEISPALLKAIEESKLSLVIFSENYASSSWCLDELVHILDCKHRNGQLVVPVFHGIDPSHVRKQKGSYEVAFAQLQQRFDTSKVQDWRSALESAANLSGWDSLNTKPESKLVEAIVEDIINKLNSVCAPPSSDDDSKGLVGISKRIEQVMSLINIDSYDNRVVGIWGIGGIGKTTLASVIFTRLFSQFEGGCFLPNVREEAQKHGLNHLRTKLMSTLLEEETSSTSNMVVGSTFVKSRLRRKKVLIVLDDVNDSEHLELLVGDHEQWFGLGSRIIVTTRDIQVLRKVADEVYEVKELDFHEALQLFQLNAFKNSSPPSTDYIKLSERVVDYAKGVPLALKVLGSYLHSRSQREWESALNKLKKMPNMKIHSVLRISYDGLDDKEKDIFLDIVCFFKGEERSIVEKVLDGCDLFAEIGITDLINKSLITMMENKVWMHDLLQEMGWEIVRQESKELGKRSRLWTADDVYRVLKTNTGTATIEGIFLDMSKMRDVDLNPEVFVNMYNLRLLKIYNSNNLIKGCKLHFTRGLQCLPDALRYLHWYGYPLKSLPSNFNPENLVVLEMTHSHIEQLWSENQCLEKLRKIDLSYSDNLTQFPDLSQAPCLENMNLGGHTNLLQVPSYLEYFDKLTILNLSGNSNLKNLTAIPQRITYLDLEGTGIEELPSSFGSLDELFSLILRNCKGLKKLPGSMHKLKSLDHLNLYGCSSLDNFPDLPMEIRYLNLSETAIEQVPSQIEDLSSLKILDLGNCRRLKTVPKRIMPLTQACNEDYKPDIEEISFMNCLQLDENALDNLMEYAQLRVWRMATAAAALRPIPDDEEEQSQLFVCCPGNKIPSWFSYQSEGSSISIKLPLQWLTTNFLGFSLCVVVAFNNYKDYSSLVFQTQSEFTTRSGESYKFDTTLIGWVGNEDWGSVTLVRLVNADHLFLWYDHSLNINVLKGDERENWYTNLQSATEVSFEFNPLDLFNDPVESCYVKKCGVCLMYAQGQDSTIVMDEDVGKLTVGESSKSKRPRQAFEPIGTVIFSDEGDKEEEEPQPKRN
ncbi:disease resistance protein RPV1-like [Humulus lupulus]|uniref:disease resistance protein RPV1-like n=1 Tax=Humulus lupulus TaxID=3486 RepID=UPI002B4163E8|nr:disease resistance protein RPV1-like [Humulus lupulus]